MDVISRIGVIIAPAIRPDPGRPELALPGSEDDPEGFVVEYQWQTRHTAPLQVVRSFTSKAIDGPLPRLSQRIYPQRVTDIGETAIHYSDTFTCVSE
jgi:hypothetical protein